MGVLYESAHPGLSLHININIGLKQLRKTNDEITELIKRGKAADVGTEQLRALMRIMPEEGEVRDGELWRRALVRIWEYFGRTQDYG